MAERTVTIRLKLDVSDVVDKAQEAELALDRLDKKVDALGRKSADVKIDLNGMAKAMADLDVLERKIKSVSGVKIGVNVSNLGGGGGGLLGGANSSAGPASGGIAGALGSVLNVQPTLAAAIVGAIIALSPAIAGALNAAFMEAAGLGGLALGIVGQLKNPIVDAAATDFGESIKGSLYRATRDFETPIVQSLRILSMGFERDMNAIDFSGLAKQLVPLAAGISGFMQNLNLGSLFKDAEPILHEFSALLPFLGKVFGDFFHEIERSRGTMEGLRAIFLLVAGAVEVLGHTLGFLGNAFDLIITADQKLAGFLAGFYHALSQVFDTIGEWLKSFDKVAWVFNAISKAYEGVSKMFAGAAHFFGFLKDGQGESQKLDDRVASLTDELNKMGNAIPEVSQKTKDLVDHLSKANDTVTPLTQAFSLLSSTATSLPMVFSTISSVIGTRLSTAAVTASGSLDTITADLEGKVFNALIGVTQATIGYNMAIVNLDDAVKQNGTTLNSHTKAGLQNQLAILSLAQANQQLYQANIASGKSADEATQIYEDNAKALEDEAVTAGYNRDAVHGLIGQLATVPRKTEAELVVSGLTDAITQLSDAITKLAYANGYRADAWFVLHMNQIGDSTPGFSFRDTHGQAMGGVVRAASGILAPSNPGTLVLAGEPQTGGELFLPLRGISRSRAMNLAQIAGNAYGFTVGMRGQYNSDPSSKMTLVQEHRITIDGTGLLRNLRIAIADEGGDVQKVLGTN